MSINQLTARLVANTPLDTDFGHGNLGHLGDRSVQQVPAGNPRGIGKAFSDFVQTVKSLGERLLSAVTPHGVRADSKFRAGLQATSLQVTELLGALSQTKGHTVDGIRAMELMGRLTDTASPVTDRGVDYSELLAARVKVCTSNMSTRQLTELKHGLALVQNSAMRADESSLRYLQPIDREVNSALQGRLLETSNEKMLPILRDAIAQIPREANNPGAVTFVYDRLYGVASDLLKEHAYGDGSTAEQFRDKQRALIKEAINDLIDSDSISAIDVGAMFGVLPSQELRALVDTSATIRTENPEYPNIPFVPFTLERVVTGSIGVRAERSEVAFIAAAEKLLAHNKLAVDDPNGSLHAPQSFAREIVTVARHLSAMTEHAAIHDLRVDDSIVEKKAQLRAHLDVLLQPSNLLLGELNNTQLHEFSAALKSMGIEGCDAQIAEEIGRRKETGVQEYCVAMQGACTHALNSDLSAMLRSLHVARQAGDSALEAHVRLGELIEGPEDIRAFRDAMVARSLAALDEAGLAELFGLLKSPEVKALIGSLGDLGVSLITTEQGEREALGRELCSDAIDLMTIDEQVIKALTARGVSLPPLPDETEYGVDHLGAPGREILRDVFGIEIGTGLNVNVKVGNAGPGFNATFERVLAGVPASTGKESILRGGEGTGISQAMWVDLGRASYSITGEDGSSRPMLDSEDREQWNNLSPETQTACRLAATGKLSELVGGDKSMLMLVSQYANQATLAGIAQALTTADSPIRLPDGTPIYPMGGHQTIGYNLRSDGDGGVLLRVDFSEKGMRQYVNPRTGESNPLVSQDSNYHFTFEIHIGADRQVSVSDPVQYFFDINPDVWEGHDYPKPKSVSDVLGTHYTELKRDFRAHAEAELSVQNLDFVEGLGRLAQASPGDAFRIAQELAATYVSEQAPAQVNLSSMATQNIIQGLTAPEASQLSTAELLELFSTARTDAERNLSDAFQRFQQS